MIVCPNCNHQNPDGATQCEACYTPLPETTACPNCGASIQTDAAFCGQCGFRLNVSGSPVGETSAPNLPDLVAPEPLIEPEPLPIGAANPEVNQISPPAAERSSGLPPTVVSQPPTPESENTSSPDPGIIPPPPPTVTSSPTPLPVVPSSSPSPPVTASGSAKTQLQIQLASLLHLQTNTQIELPANLSVIHIGKPNDQIPPDIDVSGFPHSEIVSRVHADIRVEGDTYYIEDVGSSNGTYINHTPLSRGNRHRLRPGDRISLGKGDQVTFLFQSS
ncbi:MAG TPA: FHA domain-containing protein [Allocoleopsis sp.]